MMTRVIMYVYRNGHLEFNWEWHFNIEHLKICLLDKERTTFPQKWLCIEFFV